MRRTAGSTCWTVGRSRWRSGMALDNRSDLSGRWATRRAGDPRSPGAGAAVSLEAAEPWGVTITAIGQHLQVLEERASCITQKAGRVRSCRLESAGFRGR